MTHEADAAYMSSPQAARLLGITGVGVAQLIRQGRIPAVKIANRWLIPRGFVEEFARTYEGKRGRPRKVRPAACPAAAPAAPIEDHPPEEAPAAAAAAEAAVPEASAAEAAPARTAPAPETTGAIEPEGEEREGAGAFRVSAEVHHLDRNYDFEVYESGRITPAARIIVARLKPRISSLPQFSFRWDYRYEHLNVDIHGVEPAVLEWWTMGRNGYTGHLPRRLAAPGHAFEAIIWLPVTLVFRGRLTLSGGSAEVDNSSSVASTTGGLRKLWSRWQGKPRPPQ